MGSALNFAGCLIGAPISSHITALRSTRSPRSASRSSVAHVSRCACLQFRALAVSTAMCGVLGAVAVAAMQIGLQVQPVARVSSVADAIALARQQRVRPPQTAVDLLFLLAVQTTLAPACPQWRMPWYYSVHGARGHDSDMATGRLCSKASSRRGCILTRMGNHDGLNCLEGVRCTVQKSNFESLNFEVSNLAR